MAILKLHATRLGDVSQIVELLEAVENAYDNLYAFDLIVEEAKTRYEPMRLFYAGSRRRTVRRIAKPHQVVLPEDRLVLHSVEIHSPGFWEFLGTINPLEVLRKYLNDRHEREKDRDYRNSAEAERLRLENEKLTTDVVKDKLELLRAIGLPEDRIRDAISRHLLEPLGRIDKVQDAELVVSADVTDRPIRVRV